MSGMREVLDRAALHLAKLPRSTLEWKGTESDPGFEDYTR